MQHAHMQVHTHAHVTFLFKFLDQFANVVVASMVGGTFSQSVRRIKKQEDQQGTLCHEKKQQFPWRRWHISTTGRTRGSHDQEAEEEDEMGDQRRGVKGEPQEEPDENWMTKKQRKNSTNKKKMTNKET